MKVRIVQIDQPKNDYIKVVYKAYAKEWWWLTWKLIYSSHDIEYLKKVVNEILGVETFVEEYKV